MRSLIPKPTIVIPVLIFIILLFGGASIFSSLENWRYLDSIYFTVVTVTTVGYGDIYPQTDIGKVITIIFSFAGIGLALYFFSLIGKYLFREQVKRELIRKGRVKENKGVIKI